MPQYALAGGGVGICVYEAADGGVIIAGLQIIQLRFGIEIISAVTQGVDLANRICQRAGNGKELTAGVEVVVGCAVYGLAQAQAVAVVGIGIGLAVDGSGGKPSALSPGKGTAAAIVVA